MKMASSFLEHLVIYRVGQGMGFFVSLSLLPDVNRVDQGTGGRDPVVYRVDQGQVFWENPHVTA
jgi:hypothetical protein